MTWPGRLDEFLELPVRDWCAVDGERVDRHAMDGRFFGIMPVRSHTESAAGNPDHFGAIDLRACFCIKRVNIGLHGAHWGNSISKLLQHNKAVTATFKRPSLSD